MRLAHGSGWGTGENVVAVVARRMRFKSTQAHWACGISGTAVYIRLARYACGRQIGAQRSRRSVDLYPKEKQPCWNDGTLGRSSRVVSPRYRGRRITSCHDLRTNARLSSRSASTTVLFQRDTWLHTSPCLMARSGGQIRVAFAATPSVPVTTFRSLVSNPVLPSSSSCLPSSGTSTRGASSYSTW